jgi:hypothetical protein
MLCAAGALTGVGALFGGCVAEDTKTLSSAHQVTPDAGQPKHDAGIPKVLCRVTGGGQIEAGENPDSFGGNAGPFRGGARGHWNHVTHDDGHLNGSDIDFVECSVVEGDPAAPPDAPANAIRFGGTGTFNGEECSFVVYIEDHGEPALEEGAPGTEDFYSIDIDCPTTDYSAENTLLHGNLQIHEVPPGHL